MLITFSILFAFALGVAFYNARCHMHMTNSLQFIDLMYADLKKHPSYSKMHSVEERDNFANWHDGNQRTFLHEQTKSRKRILPLTFTMMINIISVFIAASNLAPSFIFMIFAAASNAFIIFYWYDIHRNIVHMLNVNEVYTNALDDFDCFDAEQASS